jgi:hypothetical protein
MASYVNVRVSVPSELPVPSKATEASAPSPR